MAELDFSDLVPKELSFEDLVPQKTVAESAAGQGVDYKVPAAISDIPKEIGHSFSENVSAIKRGLTPSGQGERGFLERSGDLAKGILGIPGLIASPITGAARSLIGHPMADAEQAVGENIVNPIAEKLGGQAQHPDPQKIYETAKGDVDKAFRAGRPAGAPVKGPNYQWQAPSSVPASMGAPSIPELKAAATEAYQSPEVLGLEIKPAAIQNFADQTQLSLSRDGLNDVLAPKTHLLLDRIQKTPPAGSTVSGQNLDTFRKTLGKLAGSSDPYEKAAASKAIDHLDNFIPNIDPRHVVAGDTAAAAAKLEEARGNYSAAMQSGKIDKKIVAAEVRAAAANSGMNVENTIRQRMADVVLNPKEARGLLPSEIAQAKKISEGTPTQNTLRFAGNILGGGGGLQAVVTGIPTVGMAPAVGFGLKVLSNRMTVNQANRLSEAIRTRAPLASSVQKFGQAFSNYQASKSPSAYAGAVIAARNLSNNLPSDFGSSIGGLLRDLQPPNRQGE